MEVEGWGPQGIPLEGYHLLRAPPTHTHTPTKPREGLQIFF